MFFAKKLEETTNDIDVELLQAKLDFFEKSNRIARQYPKEQATVMNLFADILSRIMIHPVSICLRNNFSWSIYGEPFEYVEEFWENIKGIKPITMLNNQSRPVVTLVNGFIVWHNPGYSFGRNEDFLITAALQISMIKENMSRLTEVEQLSVTDALTGIYNRRYLMERLKQEVAKSTRYESSFAFLIMDIDYFKRFNDTYGHQVGDEVLQSLSSLLKTNMREEDILARYGGEEFCAIIPNCNNEGIYTVAEKIRGLVEWRLKPPALPEQVTISVGGAVFPEDAKQVEQLLKCADTRLYVAKENGRNKSIVN